LTTTTRARFPTFPRRCDGSGTGGGGDSPGDGRVAAAANSFRLRGGWRRWLVRDDRRRRGPKRRIARTRDGFVSRPGGNPFRATRRPSDENRITLGVDAFVFAFWTKTVYERRRFPSAKLRVRRPTIRPCPRRRVVRFDTLRNVSLGQTVTTKDAASRRAVPVPSFRGSLSRDQMAKSSSANCSTARD